MLAVAVDLVSRSNSSRAWIWKRVYGLNRTIVHAISVDHGFKCFTHSSTVAIIVPIHAVISLSAVQGIQHVYPYRLFRSFVYNIFVFNEISCLRCIYLYRQRVCNAQYGPQLYVNSCWQRAEICRDPHQDCFRTKHRFIATYHSVQLLSLLLCCCTLRLSRCQTSVDYFIMSLAKEESDRSFLESGRVIRRMTPYQSQFVSQANQREQFSHFASFFFLGMCLILERFGGVWCKLGSDTPVAQFNL